MSADVQHVSLQIDIVALYLLTLSQMISSGLEVGKIIHGEGWGEKMLMGGGRRGSCLVDCSTDVVPDDQQ